jgi:hypothetical protein
MSTTCILHMQWYAGSPQPRISPARSGLRVGAAMAELHGEASSGDADRRRFNKPMPPSPSFFLVDSVPHLCASPGRPWWQGGAAWRSGGLLLRALDRPWWRGRVPRRTLFVCLLGSWASRARRLHPHLSCFPGALAAAGLLREWRLLASIWEFLGVFLRRLTVAATAVTFGLKGVGHRFLCFDRYSCCCLCYGGSWRRPRRIWRRSSGTGSRFVRGSRVLSALL